MTKRPSSGCLRVSLIGASGRMGLALARLIQQSEKLTLAQALVSPDSAQLGRDIGPLAGIGDTGVMLGTELADCDVVIDFSSAENFGHCLSLCHERGLPLVSGTTGLNAEQHQLIRQLAKDIPILWAANMSVGVHMSYQLAAHAARALGSDADIEIVEWHHRHKKDAPSGTALQYAQVIKQNLDSGSTAHLALGRSGSDCARKSGEIGISAVRGGDIIGEHTVVFALDGERIELTHKASHRDAFAQGALKVAMWLAEQPAGLYEFSDFIAS